MESSKLALFVVAAAGLAFTLGTMHILVSSICNLVYIIASGSLTLLVRKHPVWERCQRWIFGTLIGFFAFEVLLQRRAVIGMIAGRCDWCGETHIYGEKLDQLIAVSVDERHFRGLWNDSNNIECLGC